MGNSAQNPLTISGVAFVGTLVFIHFVSGVAAQCVYKNCNLGKPGYTNIHLIPHSHNDMGWLITIDQYYYVESQYILDTMVDSLRRDPARRFTFVEMGFFYRWWRETSDDRKALVRDLVAQGRLQFTMGAWGMADEAVPTYIGLIDAHTLGLRFLKQEFGECGVPRTAWQIDSFGHSREFAYLFAMMGYDSVYFTRIDYQDKTARTASHTRQLLWRGSDLDSTPANSIWTVVFPGNDVMQNYSPPPGFYWEINWGAYGEPMMDDPLLDENNVKARVDALLAYIDSVATTNPTSHVFVSMGDDFMYRYAGSWFTNMDRLIKHINERKENGSKYYAFYSNPACYTLAVHTEKPTGWTVKTDDFFPYADKPNGFWTGFYTSRPTLKYYARLGDSFQQVASQLNALAGTGLDSFGDANLFILRDASSIVGQDHTSINGCLKQTIVNDNLFRLTRGIDKAQEVVNNAYQKLLPLKSNECSSTVPKQYFCWLLNETICDFSTDTANADQFVVTIYSPISHKRTQWFRIPVIYDSYEVADGDGKMVSIQVIPINPITRALWLSNAYNASLTRARFEVVFRAELPPLGWNTFYFKRLRGRSITKTLPSEVQIGVAGELVIENDAVALTFDTLTGQLAQVNQKQLGLTMPLEQSLRYYFGWQSDGQKSGVYYFRPTNSTTYLLPVRKLAYLKGPLVSEVYQQIGLWAGQVIRLYRDSEYFEIEWTVGPIDVSDGNGKEVISLYTTKIDNRQIFWGDLNARQMLSHKIDYRPTWDFKNTEPVAGNYYSFPIEMNIQDVNKDIQLTIFTDRCQGGTSLNSGSIEMMLHRRLLFDDGWINEALNEPGVSGKGLVARGVHYVLLHSIAHSAQVHREIGNTFVYFNVPTFASPPSSARYLPSAHALWSIWSTKMALIPKWSGLQADIPPNIQITTLQQWDTGTLLLRLAHLFGPNEEPKLAKNVTIDLQKIFTSIKVVNYEELTLGANMLHSEWVQHQIKWNVNSVNDLQNKQIDKKMLFGPQKLSSPMLVTLQPSEIRTYKLHIS